MSAREEKRFYTSLFLYVAFKQSNQGLDRSEVTTRDYKPDHTDTSAPFLLERGGGGVVHGYTSKLCHNLAIQTTVCYFNVTFMAIQVKSRMSLHDIYP